MSTNFLKLFAIGCITAIIALLIVFNVSDDLHLQNPSPIAESNTTNMHSSMAVNYKILPMDKLIIGNPLKLPECRNAILIKENIDITDLLINHLPKIYNVKSSDPLIKHMLLFLQNRSIPQLWGREQLNALTHNVQWWSGGRTQVSYDPFWYFDRKIDPTSEFQKRQSTWQHHTVAMYKNGLSDHVQERSPWYSERIHFTDIKNMNENINITAVDYEWNKLMNVGYKNKYDEHALMPQVSYYHIPKCGSSSVKWMLNKIGCTRIDWRQSWFYGYPTPNILHKNIQCGFTFVRHPIHRFISAYYTIDNMLRFDTNSESNTEQQKNNTLKIIHDHLEFWSICDECSSNYSCLHRVSVFVNELVNESWKWINNYENILSTRVMEHIGSMVGQFMGNYDGWDIHYIGKVEYFENHWIELSQNVKECSVGYLDRYWNNSRRTDYASSLPGNRMRSWLKRDKKKPMIEHHMARNGQKGKNTLNRMLVDAYYAFALDRKLYDKLVDYYYQDFVCFGYDMSYESFMQYIMDKDPSFDRNDFPQKIEFD